jgi:type I restriction enzyme S subunit
MSRQAPVSWTAIALSEAVEGKFTGPSPTCDERQIASPDEWGLLKTTAVTWSGWDETAHKVPPRRYWGNKAIEVHADDVLITKAGPRHRVGVVVHVPATRSHLMVSGKMVGLRPRPAVVLPQILAALLSTRGPQDYLNSRTSGMAESQTNFSDAALLETELVVPTMGEQLAIAEVLQAMNTQVLLAKAKLAKLTLLGQGINRGILEPSNKSGWTRARLCDLVSLPSGQVNPTVAPFHDMTLIAPDHIESGTGKLLGRYTAAEQGATSGKYLYDRGDVVYSKIRPYLRKAVLADAPGICSADMYPMRPGPEMDSRYLLALLLGERFSQFAESVSMRTGIPKLNRDEFSEFWIEVPSRDEQERSASALIAHDLLMASEYERLAKLERIRDGLVQDLLRGSVRVPVEVMM